MKKSLLLTLLMLVVFALPAISQSLDSAPVPQYWVKEDAYKTSWQMNRFRDNWTVSIGSGAQMLMGEDDSKAKLMSRFTYAPSISVAKFISPIFGFRVNLTGGSLHGYNDGIGGTYRRWNSGSKNYMGEGVVGTPGYPSGLPGNSFMSWDPQWNYMGAGLGSGIVDNGTDYYWAAGASGQLYMQSVRYAAVNFNVMVNLATLIDGYNPRRFFELSAFGGPSVFHVFPHAGQRFYNGFGVNGGFNAKFRLTDFASFYIEPSVTAYPDDFDGHAGGEVSTDVVAQLIGGITVNVGKSTWDKCAPMDYDLIAKLNDEINRLRNKPCCPLIEPIKPLAQLAASYVVPTKEEVKKRALSGEAYVIFEVNKTILLPSLANNKEELSKITRTIDYVKDEQDVQVDKIHISGYASPEGNEKNNENLSRKRSEALRDYVELLYKFNNKGVFVVNFNGENWAGLLNELPKTNLTEKEKSDIKDIIANTSNVETRKNKLKSYSGGRPYKYLLENIYPGLRRTDYKIEFTAPQFSVERGRQLVVSKPEMLSQLEMYSVAQSYPKGSAEFRRPFDEALRLYPNDPTANLNAAAVALEVGDVDRAAACLEKIKNRPEAYNNLGILYALQGKYAEAEKYFNMARDNGSQEAIRNIDKLGNIEEAFLRYDEEMIQYKDALDQSKRDY